MATSKRKRKKTGGHRRDAFARFASSVSRLAGKPIVFASACAIILGWAASGPLFGYSDTWQLVINTGTTIITFLMVFVIQNSQNRDGAALQIKLDELIRAVEGAENALLDLEELGDVELEEIRLEYEALAEKARKQLKKIDRGARPAGATR
ncbi:MAG: low affinity iron permease family protein [Alphaproteobacteria bacterium]